MRFACCNEMLEDWPLERQFRFLRDVGYEGIEVAAFTLAPRITDVTAGQRAADFACLFPVSAERTRTGVL